jgi:histidinol-phosphatase (PHP family)
MKKISLHGGHSGQYCDHAQDSLAEVVAAYHRAGFECVGLTEHMPPFDDAWLYPDELGLGRTAKWMQARFANYVAEARALQHAYRNRMLVLVGMESEWYPGCAQWIASLRETHGLDYVVGSVHHVGGECVDFSKQDYERIASRFGGLVPMYAAYFDAQLQMMQALKPEVVGHFDLVRLHDPDYLQTLTHADVWGRVLRNLQWMAKAGSVLDINARALLKGQPEPYVCAPILDAAAKLGVGVAYGDDAHGVTDVGYGFARVEELLAGRAMKGLEVSSSEALQRVAG